MPALSGVVPHPKQRRATAFHVDLDAAGAGIQAVFQELLGDRCRAFDDFPGRTVEDARSPERALRVRLALAGTVQLLAGCSGGCIICDCPSFPPGHRVVARGFLTTRGIESRETG